MQKKTDERFATRINEIVERGADKLKKSEFQRFTDFTSALFADVSEEDLRSVSTDELYGAAFSIWKLTARRKPGQPAVRVYNPSIEEHGWRSPHTVIEIVNDDMPFLVGSLTNLLVSLGLGIHFLSHPVLDIARNDKGERQVKGETSRESLIQIHVDRVADERMLGAIAEEVLESLAEIRRVVEDWKPMTQRLADVAGEVKSTAPIASEEADEVVEFLDWLAADHFTLLGARDYVIVGGGEGRTLQPLPDTGLGLMRDPRFMVLKSADGDYVETSPLVDAFVDDPAPILIVKSNRRGSVHRSTHMDLISVKRYGADGAVLGERRIVGHFTSVAYSRNPRNIPYLRRKVLRMVERAGFAERSHNGNALENVLATFPRDELFQISEDDLFDISLGVMELDLRPRTRLFLRHDQFDRFVSALLFVPRDRFNSGLRARVGEMLVDAYDGRLSAYYPTYGDGALARVHYIIATKPGSVPEVDPVDLEARVAAAARSWVDDLRDALVEKHGEARGLSLFSSYGDAFDPAYQTYFSPATAVGDLEKIEEIGESDLSLKFYRHLEDPENVVRLKLFHTGGPIPLSDCLPVLEHMGLRVIEEHPFEIALGDDDETKIWVHDFGAESREGSAIDLSRVRAKLEATFLAAWTGEVESDAFNRLVLLAGLTAREAAVLRAYGRYLRQAGLNFSRSYLQDTLAAHPSITAHLVQLFGVLFDPDSGEDIEARQRDAEAICEAIETELEAVSSLDEDRIIRRYRNVIRSTLRTNVFRPAETRPAKAAMAFKLDSRALDELPLPKPYREIWVYSPQVEGVHLRFGPVARGGLRWSDRREDFRTEVLGLVKAQQVKNAVIVPVGSKGGFYPKQLPAGGSREEVFEAGREAYKVFIASLLDITDNIDGDQVAPPPSVVRHDADDPYLVVAADKGTATFSDTANAIAAAYGFWLDDAFASGGSQGYDHKGMGITARGGWEAVKRHFREIGADIQNEPFTVIGVGDMSGDVFGNGMLLSEQIRLIAAFDHRDIFIDPTPDAASSFAERKRLFETPRSSWQMYDAKLISKGGGVFARSAKSIALTPEIRDITGLTAERVTPAELIHALLKSKADLLWFGGIGTYVKAREESHADAGDRANDAIRVNADELSVQVIGEGANLGVTQRARIAFARRGGRVNTDAVDNSAGVDCSDHEVNIKITLGQVVAAGDMTIKQRNKLLAEMTDEVGELVLDTNYRQTLALTLEQTRSAQRLGDHTRFMEALERDGLLNRVVETLPDDAELGERAGDGLGLTRPELSVLLAYAKITLFDELVAGDAPDDARLIALLLNYMPTPLRENHAGTVESHRLRREIISTVLCNAMINEGGIDFARRLSEETGAESADVARCYAAAREIFRLPTLSEQVNALDNKASAAAQTEMHLVLQETLNIQTMRLLDGGVGKQPIDETIARYAEAADAVTAALDNGLSGYVNASARDRVERLEAAGAPTELARRIAVLPHLYGAVYMIDVAASAGRKPVDAAAIWFSLGSELGLDWLRASADTIAVSDHWDRLALARLMADLMLAQRRMTEAALQSDAAPQEAAQAWLEAQGDSLARFRMAVAEARRAGAASLSRLSVVIGALGRLSL